MQQNMTGYLPTLDRPPEQNGGENANIGDMVSNSGVFGPETLDAVGY